VFYISHFLHNDKGYCYIAQWVPANNKAGRKIKHIQNLGKITKEQAEREKQLFEKIMTIKPIYRTIVIDPPWPMKKSKRNERPNQNEMDYKLMTIDEINNFPLKDFVSKDGAHVYLWTTHKHLPDAFQIFNSWNVEYHCTLTWIKNVGITPFSWMFSTEFVLFGFIGNIPIIRKGLRTDFKAKVQGHSVKPDEFYETVKRVSPEPRIDIFNRRAIEGFDSYGYEAKNNETVDDGNTQRFDSSDLPSMVI